MTTLAKGDHVLIGDGGYFAGKMGTVERAGHVHPDLPGQRVVSIKLNEDLGYSAGNVLVNVERVMKEGAMPDKKKKAAPGPLVEDTQTVGGIDKETGRQVIRPKTADGKADKLTEATDPRERS